MTQEWFFKYAGWLSIRSLDFWSHERKVTWTCRSQIFELNNRQDRDRSIFYLCWFISWFEQSYRCLESNLTGVRVAVSKLRLIMLVRKSAISLPKSFRSLNATFVKTRGFSRRHGSHVIGDIIKSLPTGFILLIKDFNLWRSNAPWRLASMHFWAIFTKAKLNTFDTLFGSGVGFVVHNQKSMCCFAFFTLMSVFRWSQ